MSEKRSLFSSPEYFFYGEQCIAFENIILLETESPPDSLLMNKLNIRHKTGDYTTAVSTITQNDANRFLEEWGNWRSSRRK